MDDFGLDSGGFNFFGGDTPDLGTAFDFGGGGSDLMSQFNLGVNPSFDTNLMGGGDLNSLYSQGAISQPSPISQPQGGGLGGLFGGGGGGSMLPGLLGMGGGLASMLGTLAGGGQGPKAQMGVPQKAALNQAYGANQQLGQFAQGQTPLQQMQMSLLQALQSGQGLPPGYQQLIEQAYQPQMGRLYDQAVNAGRARGFYDSPATAPPGGAILGPGLADLQGQMAQSKLGLMQSLPGMFQAPIQQQQSAAQGQAGGFTNLGGQYPTQQQQNIAPQLGQQFGAGLQGLGQSIGQNQQQAQQQQFQNSLLKAIQQGNSGLSYQAPQY
jgi:hypothetical protein